MDREKLLQIQVDLQKIVQQDLQEQIATFPEKSQDDNFRLLNKSSREIQVAIALIGKVIETIVS